MEVGHPLGRRRRRRRTCQPPPPHLGMAKVNDAEGLDKAEEDRIGGSVGSVGSGRRGPRTSTSSTNHNPTSSSLCRADSHRGFAVTCMNLRPATHVKVGYPLLCYLNRKACWTALFPTFSASGDDDDDDNIGSCNRLPARKEELRFDDADGILNDVYGTWVRGCCQTATKGADEDEAEDETNTLRVDEMALTKALADQMQYALRHNDDGANLKVRSEFHVQMTNPDRTGTVDVLVQDREESPVLLVEVGLRNEDWWKKLDQGLMCVPALKEFHKPFLFVVLTMDVKRDDDPDNIQGGRMGAYLITPRSQGDNANPRRHLAKFRMTLLWRDETRDLNQFSKHFGRILRAACLLPTWNVAPSTYKYLGPSCCRIGKNKVSVLR